MIEFISRLPAEYQEVEYIESTGTQYVNTGFSAPGGFIIEIKIDFASNKTTTHDVLCGAHNPSAPYRRNFVSYNYDLKKIEIDAGDVLTQTAVTLDPGINVIRASNISGNFSLTVNGTQYNVSGGSTTAYATVSLYLLYCNGFNLGAPTAGKLYYCKLYNGTTLARDYVPCYRKTDGEVGLYDLLNGVFYGNAGTGVFGKGPDANANSQITITPGGIIPFRYALRRRLLRAGVTVLDGAYLEPQAGVVYQNGISGLDAATMRAFSVMASNNADITKTTRSVYFDYGNKHRLVTVCDEITIPLNGVDYGFNVLGFNHDTLTNSNAYGTATATGAAGITLGMSGTTSSTYYMHQSGIESAGGYANSDMKRTVMPLMKSYMPSDWQSIIVAVNKKYSNSDYYSGMLVNGSDECFLLAEVEVFGNVMYAISSEGSQYAAYSGLSSVTKPPPEGSDTYPYGWGWWLRSAKYAGTYGDWVYFSYVQSPGTLATVSNSNSSARKLVSFAFCI